MFQDTKFGWFVGMAIDKPDTNYRSFETEE